MVVHCWEGSGSYREMTNSIQVNNTLLQGKKWKYQVVLIAIPYSRYSR